MLKQSIQPLSKPFLKEVLSEMSELQRVLLPLLTQNCPTDGCIRCLRVNESLSNGGSDEATLCEQARFLQQYMACATATIYRLNSAAQGQHSKTIHAEHEALDALFKTIKVHLVELQPTAKMHNGQFNTHVSSMLALLQNIQTDDEGEDTLQLIEAYFSASQKS